MSAPPAFAYFDNVIPINRAAYRRWLDRIAHDALVYAAQVAAGMRPSEADEIALQTGVAPVG